MTSLVNRSSQCISPETVARVMVIACQSWNTQLGMKGQEGTISAEEAMTFASILLVQAVQPVDLFLWCYDYFLFSVVGITKSHFWLMDFKVAVDSLWCLMEILFALWYLTTRIGCDSSLSHASAFRFQHKSVWLHDFCTLPWLCSPLSTRYSSLFCSCVQASWLHSVY